MLLSVPMPRSKLSYIPTAILTMYKSELHQLFSVQLGGNSLQAGQVTARIRSGLGVSADIPAAWVFSHQTIRLLADKVKRDVMAAAEDPNAPPPPPPLAAVVSPMLGSLTMRDRYTSARGTVAISFQQVHLPTTSAYQALACELAASWFSCPDAPRM